MSKSSSAAWCPVMGASWPPGRRQGNQPGRKPTGDSRAAPYRVAMPAGSYAATPYPGVPASPRLPELESEILAFWAAEGTFQRSVEARPAGDNEYVFYDGPPFANGLPHYGHLLTGFVKDAVPRYQTMRGRRVERRFGWDCHGLPAETEAEKELGVSGRGPITEFGIDRFNDYCRTSVLRYAHEWERYVTRQARWVDFRNDYKTMDLDLHGERHVGAEAALGKGPAVRGLPGAAVLLGMRDAAVQLRDPPGQRLPGPPGPGGDRRLRARGRRRRRARRGLGVDDHPLDAPLQPGPGRRARHRLRRLRARWPPGPARSRRGQAATSRSWKGFARWPRSRAPSWWAAATGRSSTTSPGRRTPSGFSPPTSSAPTRAPGSCTSHPVSARTTSW